MCDTLLFGPGRRLPRFSVGPSRDKKNKAIIRRLYEEVWNQHNPEAADEFVAADVFTRDMLPEYQHGLDGYKHLVRWLHAAIPDLHIEIENIIVEGDTVATVVTLSGTHTGPFYDLPPHFPLPYQNTTFTCGVLSHNPFLNQSLKTRRTR